MEILLDDFPLLAVNKPPGILTQGPPAAMLTLESLVRDHVRAQCAKAAGVYLGVPHRLDRSVTGVVVFARNSKGARRLAEMFRERQVRKTYWAIVEKAPPSRSGELVDPVAKLPDQPRAAIVDREHPLAREASLSYTKLADAPGGSLLEVIPTTGRYHQIRAQLAHHGMPIVGDVLYGARQSIDAREAGWVDDGSAGGPTPIALHARGLTLPHPVRFEPLSIVAPVPEYWRVRGWTIDEGRNA